MGLIHLDDQYLEEIKWFLASLIMFLRKVFKLFTKEYIYEGLVLENSEFNRFWSLLYEKKKKMHETANNFKVYI